MPVKIKPVNEIKINLGLMPNGKISKFAVNNCARHMDKYVPFDEGTLAKYYIVDNEIHYDQPYAHYMYEGIVYVDPDYGVGAFPIKDKDGNLKGFYSRKGVAKVPSGQPLKYNKSGHTYAGPKWDEKMWTAEGLDVIKEIEEYARRK